MEDVNIHIVIPIIIVIVGFIIYAIRDKANVSDNGDNNPPPKPPIDIEK